MGPSFVASELPFSLRNAAGRLRRASTTARARSKSSTEERVAAAGAEQVRGGCRSKEITHILGEEGPEDSGLSEALLRREDRCSPYVFFIEWVQPC
jgi:hypothetical protein